MNQLIECVPNFSEGRNLTIIKQIATTIETVEGIKLLGIEPGYAANRTVFTFVGSPQAVIQAAFESIKKAYELIDMSQQTGEHPRFGACDVCPLIPIANISMLETNEYAKKLGERIGKALNLSGYYYEHSATQSVRRNLANLRKGGYEGLPQKLQNPAWKPDFGPHTFNPKYGITALGARAFLIAYNVNLNTKQVDIANEIAYDVRESGRIKRDENGQVIRQENGKPIRIKGKLKSTKAIGWYIKEYDIAQVSMNLTNIDINSVHQAYEAVSESAEKRGIKVTGSELIGLIPLKSMIEAGKYFLEKANKSTEVAEKVIVDTAIEALGLNELKPFNPNEKIIEYMLEEK